MPLNEDAQPNEVRHSRKGNSAVPVVRAVHPSVALRGRGGRGRGHTRNNHDHSGRRERGAPYMRPSPARRDWSSTSITKTGEPSRTARDSAPLAHTPQRPQGSNNRRRKRHGEQGDKKLRYHGHLPQPKLDPVSGFPLPESSHRTPQPEDHKQTRPRSPPESPGEPKFRGSPHLSNVSTLFIYGPAYLPLSPSHIFANSPPSHAGSMSSREINVDENITGDASQKSCPSTEEYPHPTLPSIASLQTATHPSETMASPAPPRLQTLDTAAPSLIHGGNFDAVHNASVRVPTFRSGTLSIELPPHVRPFDWKDFSTMRPQAQQDVDHSDVRVAPVSSTSQSDTSTFLPFSLAQPGSSIVADRSDTADADEQEDTGAASQPIDPTPKLFRCAQRVQMRKDSHDKPRRLLTLHPSGFLSVTMRGSLDLVEQASLRYTPLRTSAGDGARQLVEDACVLHGTHKRTVVIGRAGNNGQLSLVRIEDGKVREIGSFERRSQAEKKGGISAVCAMMQPGIFATGGYDHLVNLWTLPNEGNGPPTPSAPLAIKHSSAIHSILPVRDTSHKLLTGSADCSLAIYDLSSERTVNALKLSNPVYHVHGVESPFCALLELGHREFQFEVRDYRLVPETPALRFGYSNTKVHGRYTRGAVHSQVFACGGNEGGCVRLWDLRKASETLETVTCFPGRKVVQVEFDGARMVVCSEDHQLASLTPLP